MRVTVKCHSDEIMHCSHKVPCDGDMFHRLQLVYDGKTLGVVSLQLVRRVNNAILVATANLWRDRTGLH